MTPLELKNSILQLAIQGRLTEQYESEFVTEREGFLLDEPPFEIPPNWRWQILGKCCEMYTGNSISESDKKEKYEGLENGFDYIGTKDVLFNQNIVYNNGVRIPFENGFRRAYKDSILMCIEGGSAGRKIAILDRDVCFGNKLCMFRTISVLNKFLFYYLQSPEFKKSFSGNITGIIGGVSIKKLKALLLPIPPKDEQMRIVSKIEELLPYIDRYEQAWSRLEDFNKRFPDDMKKSILQLAIQGKLVEQRPEEGTAEELYQQIQTEKQQLIKAGNIKKEKPLPKIAEDEIPFAIPDTWKWVRLKDLTEAIGDGIHGTPEFQINGGYFFINGNNLCDGKIVFREGTQQVSNSEYEKYKNPLSLSTILISINGTIGNIAYYNNERVILGKSACYITLLSGVYRNYIRTLLESKFFFDYAFREATQTTIKNVSLKAIRMFPIPLSPLAEQKRIVAKLEELFPLCERLK